MFASKDLFFTNSGGGYQISRSVRLRSSASGYLSKTFASAPTSKTIQTLSYWIKRGSLSSTQFHWAGYDGTSAATTDALWNSSDQLQFEFGGSTTVALTTTQVFRDSAAWYHIVIAIDTTQATAANRIKLYANGSQITAFSTTNYPAQNALSQFALNNANNRIASAWTNATPLDGYLTEVNFIDGQALTPSSFGSTNAITGVWQPIKYTGTYGTNGFYLNFSDNSNNTTTTIGKDNSGNGNNWTPNNISVTAGATYDSMLDVPTPYADGGNGRGNYAVFNPVNVSGGGTTTLTDGNLATSVGSTTTYGKILGTIGMTTGKWYWEVLVTAIGGAGNIGIGDGTAPSGSFGLGGVAGELSYQSSGNKYTNNSGTAYGASYTTNDIIGVAYDADAGSITFYKNNTSQGAITGFSGTKYAAVGSGGGTNPQYAINFGQRPFSYTPPTGFAALNTQNLPAPTISNGAAYMAATTYTGTGASLTIANTVGSASFYPDFVWVKGRSGATDHALYDSVRGTTKDLVSNSTAAETTQATGLTAFGSTGFTVGALAKMNTNAATYVGWQWNTNGGSSSSNTSGSITSTVSVGATQGFSVCTFNVGASGAKTFGHGLGVAPKMVIVKSRTSALGWCTYHASATTTTAQYLQLNSTSAILTLAGIWGSTLPTSTVVGIGSGTNVNVNDDCVAYCFAEVAGYSKFGSYTGNGSTDGPFVYCGFRPRYVMTKRTDSTGDWAVYDTSRDVANVASLELYPDSSSAEVNTARLDILSNGFKLRNVGAFQNANGGTYICMAVAENPFKYSLAR